jgi:type VI secretion system secreted protein Hcp
MPMSLVKDNSSNYEIHLNLGSIQGESQASTHSQEIELMSFTWGATNVAVRSATGTSKGGKPTVSEITVTKQVDKSSPQLFNAVVAATLIKTATISVSKSTGGSQPEDYLVITLTSVYITSYQSGASKDHPPNQKGFETVTLNFQKISIDYKVQLTSGLLASGGSASFDLTKGM